MPGRHLQLEWPPVPVHEGGDKTTRGQPDDQRNDGTRVPGPAIAPGPSSWANTAGLAADQKRATIETQGTTDLSLKDANDRANREVGE
jgi:hypothetical protein